MRCICAGDKDRAVGALDQCSCEHQGRDFQEYELSHSYEPRGVGAGVSRVTDFDLARFRDSGFSLAATPVPGVCASISTTFALF